jgi:hypothetical protein
MKIDLEGLTGTNDWEMASYQRNGEAETTDLLMLEGRFYYPGRDTFSKTFIVPREGVITFPDNVTPVVNGKTAENPTVVRPGDHVSFYEKGRRT